MHSCQVPSSRSVLDGKIHYAQAACLVPPRMKASWDVVTVVSFRHPRLVKVNIFWPPSLWHAMSRSYLCCHATMLCLSISGELRPSVTSMSLKRKHDFRNATGTETKAPRYNSRFAFLTNTGSHCCVNSGRQVPRERVLRHRLLGPLVLVLRRHLLSRNAGDINILH